MIRVLLLIAGVGFALSVVCLGGAAALGGRDLAEHGWRLPDDWGIRVDDEGAHFDNDRWRHDRRDRDTTDVIGDGAAGTRELAWSGGEELDIDVPAEVRFTQAPGPGRLVITGPKDALDNLVLEDGRLSFANGLTDIGRLRITMTAPNVTRFAVNGSDRLTIAGYRQDQLHIALTGSGDVSVEGSAREAEADVAGSGEVDLGKLAADTVRAGITGSGRAVIAPRAAADVDVSGSGEVTLLTRPPSMHKQISGSGRLIQAGPTAATTAISRLG